MTAPGELQARVVRQLVALAEADPLFRDLYLARARTRLAPLLSELDYERLRGTPVQIERGLRETRLAAAQRDWPRVKQLAAYVTGLRQTLGARAGLLDLGDATYRTHRVSLDPFTRLPRANGDAVALRDRVVGDLEELTRTDPEWREFYAARRRHFADLALVTATAATATAGVRREALEQAALAAADRGEVERLGALVDALMRGEAALRPGAAGPPRPTERRVGTDDGTSPFAAAVNGRAHALGLQALALRRHARVAAVVQDGVRRGALDAGAGMAVEWLQRPGLPGPFRDVLSVLGLQRVVTSAGTPYAPALGTEEVLVEAFPEDGGDGTGSGLLEALRLPRRWGLSRADIETSLDRVGPSIVEDLLGLDPYDYRVVCVPFDVYVRVGSRMGWGRRAQWTHFDGYQLLRDGTARALVGGDVRYGGVYDLCSIDCRDDRAGVVARFAIVRRQRLRAALD